MPLRTTRRVRPSWRSSTLLRSRTSHWTAARRWRFGSARLNGYRLVIFDLGGRALTSVELAARVMDWEEQAPQRTAFVIGGAEGLAPSILHSADTSLSLGPLTLPHQLARVVAAEQLYRALTINRGLPYHR